MIKCRINSYGKSSERIQFILFKHPDIHGWIVQFTHKQTITQSPDKKLTRTKIGKPIIDFKTICDDQNKLVILEESDETNMYNVEQYCMERIWL